MTSHDPQTNQPLPDSAEAIQRITFAINNVHVYQIPPLTSNRGFNAGSWTAPPRPTAQQIFNARLRIVETSLNDKLSTSILLEDSNTGDLFAAAPFTSAAVVQQAQDSSRFFAVRVQGEGGIKATLGIGFEDRGPAFDFSVALGEARKVLGLEATTAAASGRKAQEKLEEDGKKDFSLKEGESIHINVGGKGRRQPVQSAPKGDEGAALFSIAPPPPAGKTSSGLPSTTTTNGKSAQELGFDDGEFGEFQ